MTRCAAPTPLFCFSTLPRLGLDPNNVPAQMRMHNAVRIPHFFPPIIRMAWVPVLTTFLVVVCFCSKPDTRYWVTPFYDPQSIYGEDVHGWEIMGSCPNTHMYLERDSV